MTHGEPTDEMVDGHGGLRSHWRNLLGTFGGLGPGGLTEKARALDRAFEDEGLTAVLPGLAAKAWRCDPLPLPLPAAEFGRLEAGLAQRAELLERILQDLQGPRALLQAGALPPAMVYANPCWMRPYQTTPERPPQRILSVYAADLLRGPDGAWRVLADRTGAPAGIGYALENRRLLSRVMPEAFRGVHLRPLRPFFDMWQESLQRLATRRDECGPPAVALLTGGTGSAHWFEDMFLARTLSCALVEGGDLTVRQGRVWLKTLRGLQPVDVLLRRTEGRMLDPLEHDGGTLHGITGLMDAARAGHVRITNDPASAAAEAPALAAWLPALCERLLGEPLRLPSLPTLWLGDRAALARVVAAPEDWLLRPAMNGRRAGVALARLTAAERAAKLAEVAAKPYAYAASAALPPSVAPCAVPAGVTPPGAGQPGMVPRPIILRMFLIHDGTAWQAMEGGLARVLDEAEALAGGLPRGGLSKDVWIMAGDAAETIGPAAQPAPPLSIRRNAGELPSRTADNLFWLGRYVERLEHAARLIRATLHRLDRQDLLPHELLELDLLAHCLAEARLIAPDVVPAAGATRGLADALLATVRDSGTVGDLFAEVSQLTELVRDRLTTEMYAAFTQSLRAAHTDTQKVRRSLDALSHAMTAVVRYSALVAGVAAESMVRGGGWLFLDLGRRIERAMAVARAVSECLDLPPARSEIGLRLILELCDSAITYRGRYMTVVQPGPVLDLVLADEGNPRGLAFQLGAMRHLLDELTGPAEPSLGAAAAQLLAEARGLVHRVLAAREPAMEAALLPLPLQSIQKGVAGLSERLSRQYFALLPVAQTLGVQPAPPALRGAAA
jgi:uncharacterized circularly permuted ATP-grasp superfamily protein/uncharacterized alpha-E superfamily protein